MLPKSVPLANGTDECRGTWVTANAGSVLLSVLLLKVEARKKFTSVLTTRRHPTYSALLTTCLGLCAGCAARPFMFIGNVRSVAWSQHPVHHYAGSPPSHEPMYSSSATLAPPTTAILKPFCLISVENFLAVVDLYYSNGQLLFLLYLRIYFPFAV